MRKSKVKNTKPDIKKASGDKIQKPDAKKKIPSNKPTIISWTIIIGFFAAVFLLLVTAYGNYMSKIEALSLFLPTKSYFTTCMRVPGGLLTWLATGITQAFYYPVSGALAITIILAAVYAVGIKAFSIPKAWHTTFLLLPTILLLAIINLDYLIFSLKPVGFVLTLPIGILIAELLLWGFRKIGNWIIQSILVFIIVALGYPLLGFYALLSGALCGLSAVFETKKSLLRLVPLLITAVAAFFAPRYWYFAIDGDLILSQMYISVLPRFYASEKGWWAFYSAIFAVCLALAVLSGLRMKSPSPRIVRVSNLGGVLAIACIFIFRTHDSNFRLTLDLDRALWNQQWDKAVEIAKKADSDPTRINTVLSYIAMMRTGVAGNDMFSIIDSKAPYNTTRDISAFNDAAGPLVAYHLGLINYAYRWAMEYTIGQGESVERLKIMAKCALLNNEPALAKTYLDILYNIPMHREWAKKYIRYQQMPMEMASDPELRMISRLMCHPNEFINDGGAFESYVWALLANSGQGTPEFNELSMQAALVNRDLDAFMAKLGFYAHNHQRVPRYYQEAALLWSLLGKKPCPIAIDPMIENRHTQFLNAFRGTSQIEAEQQREAMRSEFGDTYWFYFVFNDDMLLR